MMMIKGAIEILWSFLVKGCWRKASVGSRLANHSGSGSSSLSLCALSLLWCTRLPSEEEEEEAESLRKEEGAEVEVEGRLALEKKKDAVGLRELTNECQCKKLKCFLFQLMVQSWVEQKNEV